MEHGRTEADTEKRPRSSGRTRTKKPNTDRAPKTEAGASETEQDQARGGRSATREADKKAIQKEPQKTPPRARPPSAATILKRHKRHAVLLEHEVELWRAGTPRIAGLDEVGAGPLAGPVVAACVVLDPRRTDALLGVDDSKRLSPTERERCAEAIKRNVFAFSIQSASVEEIDRLNVLQASLLAMRRALEDVIGQLGGVEHLLVDARRLAVEIPQTPLIKGDARSLSIAAASVLAKVERDAWMAAAAEEFPAHGFERHKGYGTQEHLEALRAHGITRLHRRTFEPIASMLTQTRLFD